MKLAEWGGRIEIDKSTAESGAGEKVADKVEHDKSRPARDKDVGEGSQVSHCFLV